MKYVPDREAVLLHRYARHVDRALASCKPDLIVAADTLPLCFSTTEVPIAIWNDATISGLLNYYPGYVGWSPRTIKNAEDAERAALSRAAVFAGASKWAIATAERHLPDPPPSLAVVPFGANVVAAPTWKPRSAARAAKLLTVGVDWHRKGLDIAVGVADELRARGLPAELDIAGCMPPRGVTLGDHIRVHGFIDTGRTPGRAELNSLYERADVFLMPSRAECFGIAYCEAAAHGVPSVATRTGGTESAVQDGATGILLEPDDGIPAYADAVESLLVDRGFYSRLSEAARHRFESELNWRTGCERVVEHVWRSRTP